MTEELTSNVEVLDRRSSRRRSVSASQRQQVLNRQLFTSSDNINSVPAASTQQDLSHCTDVGAGNGRRRKRLRRSLGSFMENWIIGQTFSPRQPRRCTRPSSDDHDLDEQVDITPTKKPRSGNRNGQPKTPMADLLNIKLPGYVPRCASTSKKKELREFLCSSSFIEPQECHSTVLLHGNSNTSNISTCSRSDIAKETADNICRSDNAKDTEDNIDKDDCQKHSMFNTCLGSVFSNSKSDEMYINNDSRSILPSPNNSKTIQTNSSVSDPSNCSRLNQSGLKCKKNVIGQVKRRLNIDKENAVSAKTGVAGINRTNAGHTPRPVRRELRKLLNERLI